MKTISKVIIYSLLAIVLVVSASSFITGGSPDKFGSTGFEGMYKVLETGADQTIAKGPAILHKVILGANTDQVIIGDDTTTPGNAKVFHFTATGPQAFDVETIFNTGISAYVTAGDVATFIWSPR